MENVTFQNPDMAWHIAADIHLPPEFDATKQYPTIVSIHPFGSCKERAFRTFTVCAKPPDQWRAYGAKLEVINRACCKSLRR